MTKIICDAVDFPDEWSGRRVQGCWSEMSCGGNHQTSTWNRNPRYDFSLRKKSHVFISLCQEDPRGKRDLKLVPIAFHVCSSTKEKDGIPRTEHPKPNRDNAHRSRSIQENYKIVYQTGTADYSVPPAVIPGTVIQGVNSYGTPQPAYVYKQNVSVETEMLPGNYCIVPSVYMRMVSYE